MPRRALVADTLLASAYVGACVTLACCAARGRARTSYERVVRGGAAVHAFVMLLQMVTLNVAIHSSNALLTLLISNQFVELKGAVFKRFEAGNLLQCACAGAQRARSRACWGQPCLTRRTRASSQISWSASRCWCTCALSRCSIWLRSSGICRPSGHSTGSSWWVRLQGASERAARAALIRALGWVWMSEMVVDSIKHVFVCKFNNHRSSMYRVFRLVLCGDLLVVSRPQQVRLARAVRLERDSPRAGVRA